MTEWGYKEENGQTFTIPQLSTTDPPLTIIVWKIAKEWDGYERSWRLRYGYQLTEAREDRSGWVVLTADDIRSPALYTVSDEPAESAEDVARTVCSFLADDGKRLNGKATVVVTDASYTEAQAQWLADNFERLSLYSVGDDL